MHDVELGLEILLDGPHPALWDNQTRREALRFLRKRGHDIRGGCLDRLTEAILKGPPRSWYRDDLTDDEWSGLRDAEIRLRLHKLTESGAVLPTSAQEVYDRLPGGTDGDADPRTADVLEDFASMSIEKFIQWSKTQMGMPWEECGGGWNRFVADDGNDAVKLLKGTAKNEIWPIQPWGTLLGASLQAGEGNAANTMEREVAGLLIDMPLENVAKLSIQAARWLEDTWRRLGKKQRRKLWGRIWAALKDDDPPDDFDFNTAINDAGGVLGDILYNELIEGTPRVSAAENPGFPRGLRSDFKKIAEGDDPAAKLARVRMAPMLSTLYRIDPGWTKSTFFYRMNPDC